MFVCYRVLNTLASHRRKVLRHSWSNCAQVPFEEIGSFGDCKDCSQGAEWCFWNQDHPLPDTGLFSRMLALKRSPTCMVSGFRCGDSTHPSKKEAPKISEQPISAPKPWQTWCQAGFVSGLPCGCRVTCVQIRVFKYEGKVSAKCFMTAFCFDFYGFS